MTKYTEKQIDGETVYIREDRLHELGKVDVAVFDCDGVLLDARESYSKAVAYTASMIVEAFTGTCVPLNLYDSKLNFAFKKTGGFNNDWTLTYAYVMRTLAEANPGDVQRINAVAAESMNIESPGERFRFIAENRETVQVPQLNLYESLMRFSKTVDDRGVESVDKALLPALEPVKAALNFRAEVGESIVSTLFEEVFGGPELFRETFHMAPMFNVQVEPFIENENIMVTPEMLEGFTEVLGGARLGIASGSLRNTAAHVLGDILGYFPRDAQVWHDDVDAAQKETGTTGLHKPDGYPLLRAAEQFKPYSRVLFVGDTMADHLTAERAGEKFLFAGVYGCVSSANEAKQAFLEAGCDVVAPTVAQLLPLLRECKGEIIEKSDI